MNSRSGSYPVLYPDLVAAGGLASALERLASELGAEITVVPGDWGPLTSAGIAAPHPGRRPLSVRAGADRRRFAVAGWSAGVELVTGETPDLRDVVRAGVAWGAGKGLAELTALLPFLHVGELAEAHERGPAAVVDVQWRRIREQAAAEPQFPEFGLLVEAAYAEPRLRQLYPFSSHWTLGFNAHTGSPCPPVIAVAPAHDGHPYRVRDSPVATASVKPPRQRRPWPWPWPSCRPAPGPPSPVPRSDPSRLPRRRTRESCWGRRVSGCRSRPTPTGRRDKGSGGSRARTPSCVTTEGRASWPAAGRRRTRTGCAS
ncbi:hypothetical protein K7B06_02185 [Streptomyces erythrochromogenes]|uniref:DUF6193 family natural product biosynthesis protein n=1 Tax=Streptomyces yangpuensis TaxID=1648182 RepID=UPI00341B7FDC|nr:hypothetical protein [Streptomyces erythrochromogenes]